jgi:hypothetical protein
VPEVVRLDSASRDEIEAFLSEATGERVRLGEVWLATGVVGGAVTWLGRASGLTLGRVVFLDAAARRELETDNNPHRTHLDRLGRLLVHECVHVWQYTRLGHLPFLSRYLYSYCTNLIKLNGGGSARRLADAAYRSIPFENEAFRLEALWAMQRGNQSGGRVIPDTSIR